MRPKPQIQQPPFNISNTSSSLFAPAVPPEQLRSGQKYEIQIGSLPDTILTFHDSTIYPAFSYVSNSRNFPIRPINIARNESYYSNRSNLYKKLDNVFSLIVRFKLKGNRFAKFEHLFYLNPDGKRVYIMPEIHATYRLVPRTSKAITLKNVRAREIGAQHITSSFQDAV